MNGIIKLLLSLFLFGFILLCSSCSKDYNIDFSNGDIPIDVPIPDGISKLEKAWTVSYDSINLGHQLDVYAFGLNKVYYIGFHGDSIGFGIKRIDTANGIEEWFSLSGEKGREIITASAVTDRNLIVYRGHDYIARANAYTGATEWYLPVGSWQSRPSFGFSNKYVYHAIEDAEDEEVVHLMKVDIYAGIEDVVRTFPIDQEGYRSVLESLIGWSDGNGDEIVFFQCKKKKPDDIGDRKVNLHAYNVSQGLMQWSLEDVVGTEFTLNTTPFINEGKLYFQGVRTLICIDMNTGEKLWEKQFQNSGFSKGMAFYKHMLLCHGDGFKLLNKNTGELIYQFGDNILVNNDVPSTNGGPIHIHDGIAYTIGHDRLVALDLEEFEVIWNERSPNYYEKAGGATFRYNHLSIDAETGLILTADEHSYMGIKLYKRP